MKLRDVLKRTNILLDVRAENKTELIRVLARFLAVNYELPGPELITQRVLERESQVSTGIGLGVAIPHCRIEGIEHVCMVAARTALPIDFDSIDEEPVRLVFLMISPVNTTTEYTQVLSALSHALGSENTRARLLEATTADEFLSILVEAEEKPR